MKLTLVFLISFLGIFCNAARYKGKDLDYERFRATLEINDKIIDGKVKFKYGTKLIFTTNSGNEIKLKIKSICTDGLEDDIDYCWPRLKVRTDELSSSEDGILKIKD